MMDSQKEAIREFWAIIRRSYTNKEYDGLYELACQMDTEEDGA